MGQKKRVAYMLMALFMTITLTFGNFLAVSSYAADEISLNEMNNNSISNENQTTDIDGNTTSVENGPEISRGGEAPSKKADRVLGSESNQLKPSAEGNEIKTAGEDILTEDGAYLSKWEVSRIKDGVADFDTSDDPTNIYYKNRDGNDENDHNLRVRSFDTVTYDINWAATVRQDGDTYEKGTIMLEAALPMIKSEAEWDLDAMPWIEDAEVTTEARTYDFDGDGTAETKQCQILRGRRTLSGNSTHPTVIPGSGTLNYVVKVNASKNGDKITPAFAGWLNTNCIANAEISDEVAAIGNNEKCTQHDEAEIKTCKGDTVTVTAELRLNVSVKETPQNSTRGIFNFDEGNEYAMDKGVGEVTGCCNCYGFTLQIFNHPNRKLKGVEFPEGPITFDAELYMELRGKSGSTVSNEVQDYVQENYKPLVYHWGENEKTIKDGRDLSEWTYPMALYSGPYNSGMTEAHINTGSNKCFNGGTWQASKEGNKISFTISDYEVNYRLFPNAVAGDSSGVSSYFNYQTGIENIGVFSSSKIFIVQSFNNLGIADSENKGKYIADDVGIEDCNFYFGIRDVKLRAISTSGASLDEVEDNSNQSNLQDDTHNKSINLTVKGNCSASINYGNYSKANLLKADSQGLVWALPETCYQNGKDFALREQDLTIVVSYTMNENGDTANRAVAAELLAKFDAAAMTPTGETHSQDANHVNLSEKYFYGVKPDGSNWENDDEMEAAKIEELVYYESLNEIPEGHRCVAFLVEVRPKNNDAGIVKKLGNGGSPLFGMDMKVGSGDELVGNVYQITYDTRVYTRSRWNELGGNIPSMIDNPAPETLPETSFSIRKSYAKSEYDEEGNFIKGHSGGRGEGDSLYVIPVMTRINKRIEQKENDADKAVFMLDDGQRYADFVLTPAVDAPQKPTDERTTVTVSDVLPKGLEYVPHSAYIGGYYIQNIASGRQGSVLEGTQVEPTISLDEDGNTVLTWKYENVKVGDPLGAIRFTALIGTPGEEETDVKHNDQIINKAYIRAKGENRDLSEELGNIASAGFKVSKLIVQSISKVPKEKYVDIGEPLVYELKVGNNGGNSIDDAIIIESLPYNGDTKGSKFNGELNISNILIDDTNFSNLDEWKCYYTTDEAAKLIKSEDISVSELAHGKTIYNDAEVSWNEVAIETSSNTIPMLEGKMPIVLVWVGQLKPGETFTADVALQLEDMLGGEIISNGLEHGGDRTDSNIYTINRKLSGIPWIDEDKNGQRSSDEEALEGVKISLLLQDEESGNWESVTDQDGKPVSVESQIASTDDVKNFTMSAKNSKGKDFTYIIKATANANGSYVFEGLPSGNFGVKFEDGTTCLAEYEATVANSGPDNSDSDGIPTLSEKQKLQKTEIHDLEMPIKEVIVGATYELPYNDSGFYLADVEYIEVEGNKTWEDDNNKDGARPESITIRLIADGEEVQTKTVTAQDNWAWRFTDLPKYRNGENDIIYTIAEDSVDGYISEVEGYNVTNIYTPKPKEDPADPDEDAEDKGDSLETGDKSNIAFYTVLAIVSMIIALGEVYRRRVEKHIKG